MLSVLRNWRRVRCFRRARTSSTCFVERRGPEVLKQRILTQCAVTRMSLTPEPKTQEAREAYGAEKLQKRAPRRRGSSKCRCFFVGRVEILEFCDLKSFDDRNKESSERREHGRPIIAAYRPSCMKVKHAQPCTPNFGLQS